MAFDCFDRSTLESGATFQTWVYKNGTSVFFVCLFALVCFCLFVFLFVCLLAFVFLFAFVTWHVCSRISAWKRRKCEKVFLSIFKLKLLIFQFDSGNEKLSFVRIFWKFTIKNIIRISKKELPVVRIFFRFLWGSTRGTEPSLPFWGKISLEEKNDRKYFETFLRNFG